MSSKRGKFVDSVKVNNESRGKLNKKKVFAAAMLGASAIVGAGCKVVDIVKDNKHINLAQAFEMGETTKSLNISDNIVDRIKEVDKNIHQDHTTNIDLINALNDSYELALDVVKEKLYRGMDKKDKKDDYITAKEDISVYSKNITRNGGPSTEESISNNKTDTSLDYKLSGEMCEIIKTIGGIQDWSNTAKEGEGYKRDELIERCESALKDIKTIAAYKIKIVDKNIEVEVTKVKDLKENDKETGKVNTTQEIDDDEMEL